MIVFVNGLHGFNGWLRNDFSLEDNAEGIYPVNPRNPVTEKNQRMIVFVNGLHGFNGWLRDDYYLKITPDEKNPVNPRNPVTEKKSADDSICQRITRI